MIFTKVCIPFALLLLASSTCAQQLGGKFIGAHPEGAQLFLFQTRGSELILIDSARIVVDGAFEFSASFDQLGFYRLALNDSNQVDLILDPRESRVSLEFSGFPLQGHMVVLASDENQRLSELNALTRQTAGIIDHARQSKWALSPRDTAQLATLDSMSAAASTRLQRFIYQLVQQDQDSYLAKTLELEDALEAQQGKGPMAVAAVFDLSDPSLLRSSLYDRAVMTFLRNVDAINEEQFSVAADSLMEQASHDPSCKAYMLDHLIALFSTYGPELALQHMIDRYVVPVDAHIRISPELRKKVDELLKVSVGRIAPDIEINDNGCRLWLEDMVQASSYTALFFYSSTCEHCHAEMPIIKAGLARFGSEGYAVIGIALDADSMEFLASIADNGIPWKCYSEFKGWGAASVQAYQVKATPTIYLLDHQMRIVAKPIDAQALNDFLSSLF